VTDSTTDRLQRVDAMFDAALDQPTAEQTAFVERVAGGDPALRDEIMQLLRAHHLTGSVLDTPVGRVAAVLFSDDDSLTEAMPERVGPFRVVRTLGQGGMGHVFLGERMDGQFEQRVALKLIRHPMPGIIRRFLEERRILASLEHKGIARLIDGGITSDGLPYFAMEFVDGEPIDRYCATRNLSLDTRLALFESVCDAVAYAHQHLVIHRDLKPANIFVTADGQVKLLDFGIAKLLDGPGGRAIAGETQTGVRVMTPEVAAPEQVRGGAVSTATDVYALGILLYLLLTGERPYDLRGKSPSEVERTICDYQPPDPSTRAPAALRRRIRGDLDLIVATALQKNDERRYQSPAALAEDLRRLHRGQAIVARPDTFTYRLGRFVARHRVAVAAAVLALIGVSAAAGREVVLRRRAQIEAQKAREVENFLIGVFDVADPFAFAENDRGTIRARDLLDRGARRIDSTLVDQPEVQADLRAVLGRVYTNLGLLEQATPLLRRSLDQRTATLGASDTSVATSMDLLGIALARQNKYADAERLLRAALDQRRKLLGNRSEATAESMNHLGTLLEDRNQYPAAESLHRESLAIKRSIFGDGSLEVAAAMNDLALIRSRRGAYAEADSLFRPVLTTYLRRFGERHALTAATMQNMASNYQFSGKLDDAERYYRRSLAAKRAVLGEMHPSVTISLNNFGAFLANNGKLEEGESMVREALRLDRKMFGDRHSYVAESLRNLGTILRNKGDFGPADSAYQAALSINRELFGERHERIANLYGQIGHIRYQLGAQAESIRLFRQSLEQFTAFVGPDHLNTLITQGNLARGLSEAGPREVAEADSLSRATLAKLDSSNAAQRAYYISTYRTLGAALLGEHRVDDALPVLSRALDMTRRMYGDDNWRTAFAQLWYGNALVAKQRYDDAAPVLHAAQATLDKHRADQPHLAMQAAAAVASLGAHGPR